MRFGNKEMTIIQVAGELESTRLLEFAGDIEMLKKYKIGFDVGGVIIFFNHYASKFYLVCSSSTK